MAGLTVDQVLRDLERLLAMAAGTHALAVDGIRLKFKQLMSLPRDPANPDALIYFGIGDPNDAASQKYAAWTRSNLPMMLDEDGFVIRQLGQQWAVFVFDEWDSWVRKRLAEAHGCDKNDIQVDVFGDLRLIRNDIIHNGGTASEKWSGKARVLKWFVPGHPITISAEHVAEFMAVVPWEELPKGPH
jgi:hypothetical protein